MPKNLHPDHLNSSLQQLTDPLLHWYGERGPHAPVPGRGKNDPYAIWIAEVMLQQTQVKTVTPYYNRWLDRFPDVRSLALADQGEVLKLWEGLGYYTRARNLHKAAGQIIHERGAKLPENFEDWLALPGVGRYTAAAIASIAFGEPVAVVDGNVLRVVARYGGLTESIDSAKVRSRVEADLNSIIPADAPGDFNQAIMDLGREVCTPKKPLCTECPLRHHCLALGTHRVAELPLRYKKAPAPEYRIVVGLIRRGDQILIQRRPEKGLLGGLWEFPGGKVEAGESLETALIREVREETGLEIAVQEEIITLKHAYSHFRIHLTAFWCDYRSGDLELKAAEEASWVKQESLQKYAFPRANNKILEHLKTGSNPAS